MSRIGKIAVAAGVVVGATIMWQQPAFAACHAFEIAVRPATVGEGGTVTVTVTRDAGINPSSIQVSSVNESAQAGSDYPTVQRTISFASETQQTFTIAITDDTAAEPDEAFRLHLSNPGGCPVNTNFSLGPDARVTISANDAPPPPTAPPSTAPPTTPVGPTTTREVPTTTTTTVATTTTGSTSTTATGSTTTTEASEPVTTTTATDEVALAASEGDDGGGAGAAIAVIAAVLALGGGGYVLYRRRSAPSA